MELQDHHDRSAVANSARKDRQASCRRLDARTSGVSYRGVYYAAALNCVGIATFEVDQWGGSDLPDVASSRSGMGDMLPDIAGEFRLLGARSEIESSAIGIMSSSMSARETMLVMTRRNSDALLGQGVYFKAAAAFHPTCWQYNHVPGADFNDLVDAPIRIFVCDDDDDDYDGGQAACKTMLRRLAPADAAHLSLAVLPRRRTNLMHSTAPANFTIQPEIGAKAGRSTSDLILKRVIRHALTSRNSLLWL